MHNPFLPTGPTFAVRETDVSRNNGGTIMPTLFPTKCWNGGQKWVKAIGLAVRFAPTLSRPLDFLPGKLRFNLNLRDPKNVYLILSCIYISKLNATQITIFLTIFKKRKNVQLKKEERYYVNIITLSLILNRTEINACDYDGYLRVSCIVATCCCLLFTNIRKSNKPLKKYGVAITEVELHLIGLNILSLNVVSSM